MNNEQNQSSKQQQQKNQLSKKQIQQNNDLLTEFADEGTPSAAITNPKLTGRNKPQ